MLNRKVRSSQTSIATSRTVISLRMRFEFTLKGPDAMAAFGHFLARNLKDGEIITLSGDLGAGKSTLARGLITTILDEAGFVVDDIPSPTFTLVQSYPWPSEDDDMREVWHIDLWRLEDVSEIIELGFEEALGRHAMVIEWPERLGDTFWGDGFWDGTASTAPLPINITISEDGGRILTLNPEDGSRWADILKNPPQFA